MKDWKHFISWSFAETVWERIMEPTNSNRRELGRWQRHNTMLHGANSRYGHTLNAIVPTDSQMNKSGGDGISFAVIKSKNTTKTNDKTGQRRNFFVEVIVLFEALAAKQSSMMHWMLCFAVIQYYLRSRNSPTQFVKTCAWCWQWSLFHSDWWDQVKVVFFQSKLWLGDYSELA